MILDYDCVRYELECRTFGTDIVELAPRRTAASRDPFGKAMGDGDLLEVAII
jgi:hypothetical protein